MNANQKPNSYQNTPYQPLQAGQKKDISDSHSTSTYFLKTRKRIWLPKTYIKIKVSVTNGSLPIKGI